LIEDGNDLLDLLGVVDLGGQGLVDLVEGQKTFLLALDDEAFDLLDFLEITHLPSQVRH
jgi:dihydroxyacetone kinase-like predicted kinase